MTHFRIEGRHAFECDKCGDCFGELDDSEPADFMEVWNAARDSGWVSFKVDDEWQHRCPDCKKGVGG
jgi:hypothetical protein